MIFTDRTIIVQKGTSSINDTIILYRGDKEVEIRFTLNEGSPFRFGSGASPNIIEKTEAAYGQLVIKTPNDLPSIFSEVVPTNEGKIIFTITAEMIDEITEVGDYTFQIRLFDEGMNSRATLPEVVNGIEIREPIATEDVTDTNEVGVATVGYAITTVATPEDAFDSQGNYNKTTWVTGDRITDAKLNKIEAGIDGVNKKIASGGTGGNNASDILITDTGNYFTSTNVEGALQEAGSQIKDIANQITLGIAEDGLLYIFMNGVKVGNGIDVKNMQEIISNLVTVFTADFSGSTPLASQFYSWENRVYGSAIYDALSNIQCVDNIAHLTSVYDSKNSRWIKQMMCTGGLFESDKFICEFEAKFDGTAGSWNNVITYGTGTHWTNGLYSDGVKWPAGGEIDAFEQAGGYSETPNGMKTPTVHWGSGTESGYPKAHESRFPDVVQFTTDEWHKFKFELSNGYVKIWIDDVLVGENDFSDCTVNNNYLCDYKPFLKPQAFYIDGSCADESDTSNTYDFEIKNFKIYQNANVECTSLEIYPQMWEKGTRLVFPTGAELFFDKIFTPSNTSNKACKWESSNTSVATVCEGYVKTLAEGTTIIKATCANVSATYELTVNNTNVNIPCVKLEIENIEKQLDIDTNTTFKTYVYPNFTNDALQISYSTDGIVTYDGTTLTAISGGTTTVTVICGTKTVSFEVTVNDLYGSDAILSYTFDSSTIADNLTVENKGSLGSDYNLTVNCSEHYGDNVISTINDLVIPTRQSGEPYIIIIDLYDSSDKTSKNNVMNTNLIRFAEGTTANDQPFIKSTWGNASTGGDFTMAYYGCGNEYLFPCPVRVAMWRDATGKAYLYDSNNTYKSLIKSTADSYIKDLVRISLSKARIEKLEIYYCNKTVDEVKALVDNYNN